MRFTRKTTADAQRETDFAAPSHGSKGDIDNFWIGTPDRATSYADFELSREIVVFTVAREHSVRIERHSRGIQDFVLLHTGKRAASHVANHVPTCTARRQPHRGEGVDRVGQSLNRNPMQLN